MRGDLEAARGSVGALVQSYRAHKSRTRSHQTMRFVRPDLTTLHKVLRWFLELI